MESLRAGVVVILVAMIGVRTLAPVLSALSVLSLAACRGGGPHGSDAGGRDGANTRPTAVALKAGDPAPLFSLPASDGKTYDLATYRGKQTVVLAWFVKAFTEP